MLKPQLQGHDYGWRDGRYRVYDRTHVTFDRFPAYRDGGPATVTVGSWCMAYMTGGDIEGVELRVFTVGTLDPHALHGTRYATDLDAKRAAYDAGVIAFMVYEKDASRYAL